MSNKVVLHIEDDESLANLVRLTFESFGFVGEILRVSFVQDAINLLTEREYQKLPVDLILSDMHLPDGGGLDFLQHLKSNPTWSKTPVIILSGDNSQELVSEAYSLGANCYLSKSPKTGRVIEHYQSLYNFWMQNTLMPNLIFCGGIKETLLRASKLRNLAARIYIDLSKVSPTGSEQELFWLERAMTEGNLSNLLLFFENTVNDEDAPIDLNGRLSIMQGKVEQALFRAEKAINKLSAGEDIDVNCPIFGMLESWDETLVAELFETIFSKNPSVSLALRSHGANQVKMIANYIIKVSDKKELIHRAKLMREFSQRLDRLPSGA